MREPIYKHNLRNMLQGSIGYGDDDELRLAYLHENRLNYTYKTAGPTVTFRRGPHEKSKMVKVEKEENVEELFWRLQEQDEHGYFGIDNHDATADELRELHGRHDGRLALQEDIAENHLWKRLKWLGLPDWRSDNLAAKVICTIIPAWCVSMRTVSIRGEYTRDRYSNEHASIHHHVCRLILGIEEIVPPSVAKLELRLSVPFLRYFLEQLEKRKPSIERVG